MLLRETLHPALTLAVDFSPAYVAATAERAGDDATVEVIEADVLEPARAGQRRRRDLRPACCSPTCATRSARSTSGASGWRPAGVLLLEEVESIATEERALARYLDLQREMLDANDEPLEIGPELDAGLRDHPALRSSEVATFSARRGRRRADVRDELRAPGATAPR